MNRLALLAAGAAAVATLTAAPAFADTPATPAETVTSCGPSGLQAGLSTRVCAEVTGTTVEFYGTVGLAGPPSPGSPAPAPKQLFTTLSVEVVGEGAPVTRQWPVVFTSSTVEVRGQIASAPCGSTVRAAFAVASFPWTARPVVHEVTLGC
ncbi:hypothetical protein EDD96_6488 [Streptomyces sp. Ag109_G2-6]|uniref:hypothetical protein n=1 Tax=Streptomyces sp. Ag109_G2-6 TaxID=2485154 RepID=UPI000F50ECE8|nr:hypothetical protein [Streptomyces sp. Ag109_G2-6]RPF29938.1 hypothetical protein EDD96_6488 [Streptomyces sp. Ag109_G2-6]